MAKGIKRPVAQVIRKIQHEIGASIDRSNRFSSGLAYEGYNGGYLDALRDVTLALNGVRPRRNGWWDEIGERFE